MESRDILSDVLEAAGEFNRRKLWQRFTNFDCFGVRIAGQEEPILGVVLGNAGEEYGLSLFRGPHAAGAFAALLDADGLGDDILNEMDMLGFSMLAFGELPPEDQARMRKAGRHPRYDEQVPHLLAKPAGQRARFPEAAELHLLRLVLRAAVEADKKRLLQPARLEDKKGICVLAIGGEGVTPQVSVAREHWQPDKGARTIPLVSVGLDLKGLPRLDATWLIGMPTIPAGIQGDERVMQMLLVVDEASEYVFQGRPILGGNLREAVQVVGETFRGGGLGRQKGLPRRILFSSRKLHEALTPILEPAGIQCVYEPEIPKLQAVVDDFIAHMNRDFSPLGEDTVEEVQIPAPDDLKGWKEADQRLYGRFVQRVRSDRRLRSTRAIKRYFNDDDFDYYVREHEKQGVLGAFMAWTLLDYRPTKKGKTHTERMLEEDLPEGQATLLRARMEAWPTLYRVAGHDPKTGTIDLEDVLLGGAVTVQDQLMSENIEDNVFFAARVFPAGRFHFVELAGPPLGAGMGQEAVEFLRRCGMEFTPAGLRRDAHMFGWLWRWIDEWQATRKPMELRNTDGEKFLWHTASFSVADPVATRETLLRRADIDYDERAEELVWSKPAGPDNRVMGDTVTLGRIEFVGEELVLTVNSVKRLALGRQWLEKLPGVVFKSVRTRRWDEAEKDRPLDERIAVPAPVEMTPEFNAAVQEMMNKHYMSWIDTPLPVLGGRTPRQACQTEAGRQQVTMLIRTMPDPMGRGTVRVPREAMRRELGLAAESTPRPAAKPASAAAMPTPPSVPVQAVPAPTHPKVARNGPCPCGSGRKYKKCCGR
ncbi:MAG: DUF2384 domain-containing protein [Planctomycetes bacterium]|nr:DUF2384 domain-containing protein [Planctomycetota bacterium]